MDVLRNRVSGYQKLGIWAVGGVELKQRGRPRARAHIARNGIQLSQGARGQVTGNTLSENACTGLEEDTTSAGILVIV